MSKSPIRTVNIGGKVHRLCVLRVESRDENGLPENLTFVPPSPPSPPVMPA